MRSLMGKKILLTCLLLTASALFGLDADRVSSSGMSPLWYEIEAARCALSPFDRVIREVSEREGNDWRLMSAIAYHESRFTADIVSNRGARGLMQIMPAVARRFGVLSDEALFDPRINVWLGNRVFNSIAESLGLSGGISERDRICLILAAYNGGIGHVTDARRLARSRGENPDSWEVVRRYLELKALPEYYEDEAVRCGRFTGSAQTTGFVDEVMRRYEKYCRMI